MTKTSFQSDPGMPKRTRESKLSARSELQDVIVCCATHAYSSSISKKSSLTSNGFLRISYTACYKQRRIQISRFAYYLRSFIGTQLRTEIGSGHSIMNHFDCCHSWPIPMQGKSYRSVAACFQPALFPIILPLTFTLIPPSSVQSIHISPKEKHVYYSFVALNGPQHSTTTYIRCSNFEHGSHGDPSNVLSDSINI